MRWPRPFGRRQVLAGSTLGAAAVLAIALVALLNYLAARHYQRWDWTGSGLYTLSEQTLNILEGLDEDVEAVVFMAAGSELYPAVQELLARYAAASDRVTVRTVDPARNLAEAQRLSERYDVRSEVVVFVGPEDRRVVEVADLADYDYSALQMGGQPEMTGFKGEQAFTSAIVSLAERVKPRILFTTGHGEASLDDQGSRGLFRLQDLLGRDNFAIEEWASLGAGEVPPDSDLVVVAGPISAFTPPELDAFGRYLEAGGRLLLLLDPLLASAGARDTTLGGWLRGLGVDAPEAMVVDPAKLLPFYGAETLFADDYGQHPITQALGQAAIPVVFSLARPVRPVAGGELEVTELVSTTAEGWGETDLEALGRVEQGPEDLAGPIGLGVAVELPAGFAVAEIAVPPPAPEALEPDEAPAVTAAGAAAGETDADESAAADEHVDGDEESAAEPGETAGDGQPGRLVVFGDSDFVTNDSLGQAGNGALAANSMNWLVARESHLGIPPKEPDQVRLSLAPDQRRLVSWLVVAVIPGLCLVAGVLVTWRRRR